MHCDFDVLGYFFEDFKTGEFCFRQTRIIEFKIMKASI